MRLEQYVEQYDKRVKKFEQSLKGASRKAQKKTLKQAQRESSGTVSLAELARRDHPKATRHGSPMMPLLPVNKHQGDFYRAWQPEGSGQSNLQVTNDSKVALWLDEGTRVMFAHHFTRVLSAFAIKEVERLVDDAITTFET